MSRRRKIPLPKEPQTAHITTLSHEGRGIAHIDERTVFISNALPGEEVEFLYTSINKRYGEGRATQILNASPQRVAAKCAYFGICGGCSLQHLERDAQQQLKLSTLREQLQHFANVQLKEELPILSGNAYGYRHKARLGVRYVAKKESVLVGFREQQSRFLAEMNSCDILHPKVGNMITALRELIASLEIYHAIAQIEVAVGDNDCALIFRNVEDMPITDKDKLISFAKLNELMIFIQPNKPEKLQKLWPADNNPYITYELKEFDLTFWTHPTDFTQVNPEINRKMVPLALQLLDLQKSDRVLDLFCGLGNFTLPISRFVEHVTGVEGSDAMVERATMNAERNNINNADFYCADLTQPLTAPWSQQTYNKILLDPARSGALEVLSYFKKWSPEIIVYVSCNPATLARDAGELIKMGYQLQKGGIMDMFPETNHVESIALFTKE